MAVEKEPDVVQLVEEAIARRDTAGMERAVTRSRWYPFEELQPSQKPVIEKPKYNYPRVPY